MGCHMGSWLISFSGVECLQLNTVGSGMCCCYHQAYLRQGAGLNWGRATVLLGLDWFGRGVLDRIDMKICCKGCTADMHALLDCLDEAQCRAAVEDWT